MKMSPFHLVALVAILLMLLRIIFPKITFDNTSLILFCIASVSLLLPKLVQLLPPLKRFKFLEFEAEFNEAINQLEKKVEASEQQAALPVPPTSETPETAPRSGYPPAFREYVDQYRSLLTSSVSNLEKIITAGILVERMIYEAARDLQIPIERRVPSAIVHQLTQQGFISEAERAAFDEFWRVRNLVIHGGADGITDEQTARLLDLVYRLVRTFA